MPVLLVAAGGILGALARAGAGVLLPHEPGAWAWSTLAVNAVGAALLCALLTVVRDERARLLVGTGVLGAFTTFSTFAVDAVLLADAGRLLVAASYVAVGLATLLLGGLAGAAAGRRVRR